MLDTFFHIFIISVFLKIARMVCWSFSYVFYPFHKRLGIWILNAFLRHEVWNSIRPAPNATSKTVWVRIIDTELLDIFQIESNKYDEQIQKSNLTQSFFDVFLSFFFSILSIAVIVEDTYYIPNI